MSSTAIFFFSANTFLFLYFSYWRKFQTQKLKRLPTWQWVVETGMANSLEIPQTSTVTAAIHSTQNPLADKFSIFVSYSNLFARLNTRST